MAPSQKIAFQTTSSTAGVRTGLLLHVLYIVPTDIQNSYVPVRPSLRLLQWIGVFPYIAFIMLKLLYVKVSQIFCKEKNPVNFSQI